MFLKKLHVVNLLEIGVKMSLAKSHHFLSAVRRDLYCIG